MVMVVQELCLVWSSYKVEISPKRGKRKNGNSRKVVYHVLNILQRSFPPCLNQINKYFFPTCSWEKKTTKSKMLRFYVLVNSPSVRFTVCSPN